MKNSQWSSLLMLPRVWYALLQGGMRERSRIAPIIKVKAHMPQLEKNLPQEMESKAGCSQFRNYLDSGFLLALILQLAFSSGDSRFRALLPQ